MTIKEAIRTMVKDMVRTQVIIGKVIAVDEANMCCDIDMQTGPEIYDVRIRAVIDGEAQGIMVVPEVGSYVLVGLINNKIESAFVCGYSKVDRVQVVANNKIELKTDNLIVESDAIALGGSDYSLCKTELLVEELEKNSKILRTLLDVINSAVPFGTASTGLPDVLQVALSLEMKSLEVGDFSEVLNSRVVHG